MAKMIFETAMNQLEQIVNELESGNLSLEDSIKKFEEGIKLSKFCSAKLDETEKKITILLKEQDGNITEREFSPEKVSE
ncbi:MAG: exodeoxyribonuclease VII small subunit [Desulfobacterium sp.]|nr:exodeoxyribonuclease VII small subunit [Desulfobacterium sp.]MBU3948252.1 exodeoxyribonuclease VII small subunit [Pseudomonadota bacterium]MBU4009555.1 exodeoxyribonuclease VII small subunit [Pseudomonadota bacterium]MBU4036802.1 exodeoxyribonuclease VII small subunit [Pseudomonadota bacterium]